MTIVKKSRLFVLVFSSLIVFSGCATMFGENTRSVYVQSNPSGAGIYIKGENRGKTPQTLQLHPYIYAGEKIELKKQGYENQTLVVHSTFQLVSLWNLLTGWGFLIDAATGDIVQIAPNDLNMTAELLPSQTSKK